jgi:hypothetical protein
MPDTQWVKANALLMLVGMGSFVVGLPITLKIVFYLALRACFDFTFTESGRRHLGTSTMQTTFARLRHFASFIRFFATNCTFAYFFFQHRVVGGASATKILTRNDLADIDQRKADAEYNENDAENI